MKKITFEPESIDDLPKTEEPEPKIDLHVRLPVPMYKQLSAVSREKGYDKSKLVTMALKVFFTKK